MILHTVAIVGSYSCKTLIMEKSDKFDEWMLNRQNFPYQNFALKNFGIAYFTVINY